jgi:hypothetical protein
MASLCVARLIYKTTDYFQENVGKENKGRVKCAIPEPGTIIKSTELCKTFTFLNIHLMVVINHANNVLLM